MCRRGTQEAYREKRSKKFVGQRLRLTPKSWLTPKGWLLIWNLVVFCTFFYMSNECEWCKCSLKNYKNPNERPAFGCQPAFGSHSQSLTNKLFSSIFFMRLTWASHANDEKVTFYHFWMFFIFFNHANACASMPLLVEIHNIIASKIHSY